MKNLKKMFVALLAVVTVCSSSVVSFAKALVEEDGYYSAEAIVIGTPKAGETFSVEVYLNTSDGEAIDLTFRDEGGCYIKSAITYDKDKVTPVSTSADYVFPGLTQTAEIGNNKKDNFTYSENLTIPSGSKLVAYSFTVNEGVEPGTYTNELVWIDSSVSVALSDDKSQYEDYIFPSVTPGNVIVTVKAASNVQATKGDDGIITVTGDSALVGKYILVHDTALPNDAVLSATSRFVVKNTVSNKTQSYNIFEALKVEGLDGSIATNNIKFGIVSDTALNASEFEFSFTGIN